MGQTLLTVIEELRSLAIFGGQATFCEKLHVGLPNIGDRRRLFERINEILDRRWLSNNGPFVREFEERVAALVGVDHCILVCNATVALQIAIKALGLKGEVIVPSFTFVASAHALQWEGIAPIFCDINPATHNLDPDCIERKLTRHTSAIMGVHLWGRPCEVERLREFAANHQLKLLFDAAHAFGCSYKGQMIGGFGDLEVFSFHATKFFNSFEGGAIVTNDGKLAEKIRRIQNFGFAGYDCVVELGTNGKMTEVAAAMGLSCLESLDEFIAINRRNYLQYKEELPGIPGLSLVPYDEHEKCNYQYIVLEIDEAVAQVTRDQLMEILWAENVLARRYFYPGCHRMEPYRTIDPNAGCGLPETEKLAARVICLPTGIQMNTEAITKICGLIRLVITHGEELRKITESRLLRVAS